MRDHPPFQTPRERIVVPRSVLDGLLTALHIRFSHPSEYQTKRLFSRYFFALDVDKAIDSVSSACHTCQSLKAIPSHLQPQSSTDPPPAIGVSFPADVCRRYCQLILVLREAVSSYTLTSIVQSEKRDDLRNVLLVPCSQLRSLHHGGVTIRLDPAAGFCALVNDKSLLSHGITLEVGRVKNPNKNPVAERAVEELGMDLPHLSPEGGPTSAVSLALATSNMNSRIWRDGLSAHEVWTQRDQLTGEQLPIVDRQLIFSQNFSRKLNHLPSATSKARGRSTPSTAAISVGDLVFLKGDKDKLKAPDKYLVIAINENLTCQLRKFTTSQFRSKVYTVPTSECYRVCPTVLVESPLGPIRGHHEPSQDDSDDEPDPSDPASRPSTAPTSPHVDFQSPVCAPRPDPVYHPVPVPPPVGDPPPVPADIVLLPHDPVPDCFQPPSAPLLPAVVEPPRRSGRQCKAPFWHSEDWVLE